MNIESILLQRDGPFPNNPALPLLVYRHLVPLDSDDPAATFERLFMQNGWIGTWRNGIYSFHHYHSNAHEVLGIASGTASVQFGGPGGPILDVGAGDVAILPAGTTHKRVRSSTDLLVVGAYPRGQGDYDLLRGDDECDDLAAEPAAERIALVALPEMDPVFGAGGPLLNRWWAPN